MPFLILFLVSWAAFWKFGDLRQWRRLLPAVLLSMVMSLTSDSVTDHYPLWTYHDTTGWMPYLAIRLIDDFGVYPVTAYLFLQYMPSPNRQVRYFMTWTLAVILLETLFVFQGWMVHKDWWSIACSYIADWLIFFLLYRFTVLFNKSGSPEEPSQSNSASNIVEVLKKHGIEIDFLAESETAEVFLLQMQPGTQISAHTHSGREISVLLQGQVEVSVGAERKVYRSGQSLIIQGQVVHSAINIDSREPALVLSILLSSGLRQKLGNHTADQLLLSTEPLRL
ncbi:cupin domain-containing protein [Tumebacillus flagellatus]|uniref:Cupin type-2 domain-containing protein n=1 Tax=Tumebacillus flagellatus TaxID=1157490 RepID=A0A074MAW6_9BACL|nr:cupin domain-containing protein [Tumebacillus flagellatus]KEO83057.1 hypothetical protein EL26_12275 [Tumebacillus flagellatus]